MRVGFFKKYGRVSKVPERPNIIRYYKVALRTIILISYYTYYIDDNSSGDAKTMTVQVHRRDGEGRCWMCSMGRRRKKIDGLEEVPKSGHGTLGRHMAALPGAASGPGSSR
jgi:hypothetical protein